MIPLVIGALGTIPKDLEKGTRRLRNQRTSSIINIGQNTEKYPGDLWRLAVVQTPMRSHLLMQARRPGLIIINKRERICKMVDFAVPADHRINLKESVKKDKYLDLARELKKTVEHESNDCANCDWCVRHTN